MRTLKGKCDVDMVKMEGGEDQSFGVLGRHPETRAEFTISTSLEPISVADRTGCLQWVDIGVLEGIPVHLHNVR